MVVITELWVREKTGVEYNQLHNVRSLFLPGSREERISYLGASLQSFTRLKNLDLSCNALVSLEGLHTLRALEKINLYYNRIPDLTELFRLRYNRRLREVDLRLNPVASRDPQYRLFLIHLLPELRKLDDLPVMQSERAAASSVFTSDQLIQFSLPLADGANEQLSGSTAESWYGGREGSGGDVLQQGSSGAALPDLSTDILHELLDDSGSPDRGMSGSWRRHAAATSDFASAAAVTDPDFSYFSTAEPQRTTLKPQEQHSHREDKHQHNGTFSGRHTSVPVATEAPDRPSDESPSSRSGISRGNETTELLTEAARRVAAIVEEYRHASAPLGFHFQERIIGALDAALVSPLLAAAASTATLLRDDLRASEERAAEMARKVTVVQSSKERLERHVQSMVEAEGLDMTTARTAEEQLAALANILKQARSDRRSADDARRATEEAANQRDSELRDELATLQRQLDEESAQTQHERARANDLMAELETMRSANEDRPDVTKLVDMLRESHQSLADASRVATQALEQERSRHEAELASLRRNYAELKRTADLLISKSWS